MATKMTQHNHTKRNGNFKNFNLEENHLRAVVLDTFQGILRSIIQHFSSSHDNEFLS